MVLLTLSAKLIMTGLYFSQLESFIKFTYGEDTWKAVAHEVDDELLTVSPEEHYPDKAFTDMLEKTSMKSGVDTKTVLRDYGEFLAPMIQKMYKLPLNHSFLEVLEKAEVFIKSKHHHTTGLGDTNINVIRINQKRLEIIYSSTKNVPDLAVGILKGLAKLYKIRVVTEVLELSDGNYLITLETR